MIMVLAMAFNAYAIDTVQVTLTSPAIVKKGCEKVGAVTYAFDAGTKLTVGDWWYFDLPTNVTICNNIDYMMGSGAIPGNTGTFITVTNDITRAAIATGMTGVLALAAGAQDGPFSVTDLAGGAPLTIAGGSIFFRVRGVKDTRRVWMYVYGDVGATLTVGANSKFNIYILDGQDRQANIVMDTDADAIFGELAGDTIDHTNVRPVPHIENTLCTNAEQMGGDLMFVSFASLNDKFTFTGDAQIAHVISQNPITLMACKGEVTGNIKIASQGACAFDYETPGGIYCAPFVGNRSVLKGASTFGDPSDIYGLVITSDTPGVYFNGVPGLFGYKPTEDYCTGFGTAVPAAWQTINEAGNVVASLPGTTCAVASANRIRKVQTTATGFTGIDIYNAIFVDLPTMAYDTTVIGNGVEAKVTFNVIKYPCGTFFTGSKTIGTFVTTCPVTSTSGSVLLFPYFPPMNDSLAPWWGGIVIVNASSADGTAKLTFMEEDGDKAEYTTPAIKAEGMWNGGLVTSLLSKVTPAPGNTGTFGDANVAVKAVCTFNMGAGFAFVGNGTEATGYTAYVLNGTQWN
jgi:hypothetical protein